jgi:hypothetical protein
MLSTANLLIMAASFTVQIMIGVVFCITRWIRQRRYRSKALRYRNEPASPLGNEAQGSAANLVTKLGNDALGSIGQVAALNQRDNPKGSSTIGSHLPPLPMPSIGRRLSP